jgi:hypothetical protein
MLQRGQAGLIFDSITRSKLSEPDAQYPSDYICRCPY